MSLQRTSGTEPEIVLRRQLHAKGLRYRVKYPVPGNKRRSIDIAFPRARLAVFVDGCFWHGCPIHASWPKTNAGWWATKINKNRHRDAETDAMLLATGWRSIRIWEHEISRAADRVIAAHTQCLRRENR